MKRFNKYKNINFKTKYVRMNSKKTKMFRTEPTWFFKLKIYIDLIPLIPF